jgi:hypothetical protein
LLLELSSAAGGDSGVDANVYDDADGADDDGGGGGDNCP